MAPVVFNSSQVFREAEVLKTTISAKKKHDFSVGGELWSSCQSLQDLYKSLLLGDLIYALEKKVEQELWNSAFKSHIDNMRQQIKDKKGAKKGELQTLLMLFLETASGFYIQLLNEFCLKYTLEVPGYISPAALGILHDVNSNKKIVKKPSSSACYYICQDCLVHLGDLARYRNEIDEAELYYKQALQLVPANGQPYNQLAILASSSSDTLGTVYFYCRSIAVKNPFPAAATNLTKTLSKACQTVNSPPPDGQMTKGEFIQLFIQFHACIYLVQDLNVAKSLMEKLTGCLKTVLEYEDMSAGDLVKLVTINLFLVHHIQTNVLIDDQLDSGGGNTDKDFHHDAWNITVDFTMKVLRAFLDGIVVQREEKSNEGPASRNGIFPALQVICQWLKINVTTLCKDEVIVNQPDVWFAFVNMLNGLSIEGGFEKSDAALPEDQELLGFLPLQTVHRKLDFSLNRNSKREEQEERKQRLILVGLSLARHMNGVITCQKRDNGYYRFSCATDTNGAFTNTPFIETSSLFGSDINHVPVEPLLPIQNPVGQYSLFQSPWNVPLTVGNTAPVLVPSSQSSPIASPSAPSTLVKSSISDKPAQITSKAVGSHRSPTFTNPSQSLPVPPTSLAVGSNRPLSPGSRTPSSPNGDKSVAPQTTFGYNVTTGVWSPLTSMAGNGLTDGANVGAGGKVQNSGNGNSIWGTGFNSYQSNMSPLEQLLKEQKSQQNS